MSRVAYVNGQYVSHAHAGVHIEDRGYQFSDGIYEVCEVRDSQIIDMGGHLDRLERSADELEMTLPNGRKTIEIIVEEMRHKNRVQNGIVYIQVTRGVAPRNHLFPSPSTPASMVMTAKSTSREASDAKAAAGVGVITVPDNRWERVDIKTVSLLPNVLAKQKAHEAGAYEAWFVDGDDKVTEGSSTNAWIVTKDNILVTRDASRGILKGITRGTTMAVAESLQLKVEERRFTVEEAKQAKEAFITAATTICVPVTKIDGEDIGNGKVGEIAQRLRAHFHEHAS
ncbi:MAG: D-amino-acid transaminase [Hyphomicrobiales bacterium]